MFSCAGGAFDGSAGAAVGAAVACGSCAGGAVAFGSLVAYQACGVFGLTWFRLACGANLWGWLPCVDWVVGVLGTHFSAYNPPIRRPSSHQKQNGPDQKARPDCSWCPRYDSNVRHPL